jgi:hypothetical protein
MKRWVGVGSDEGEQGVCRNAKSETFVVLWSRKKKEEQERGRREGQKGGAEGRGRREGQKGGAEGRGQKGGAEGRGSDAYMTFSSSLRLI